MAELVSCTCSICLDEVDLRVVAEVGQDVPRRKRQSVVLTHCGHAFHTPCLVEAVCVNRRSASSSSSSSSAAPLPCPVCRSPLVELSLPSAARPAQPRLDEAMQDEGFRTEIINLVQACVEHAIKWDRRKSLVAWTLASAVTFAMVVALERDRANTIHRLHSALSKAILENTQLRRWRRFS